MKRDWDLIKKLTLYIQENESIEKVFATSEQSFADFCKNEKIEETHALAHLAIMHDEGLFIGKNPKFLGGDSFWIIERLTNSGHDLIELSADKSNWEKAKETIKSMGSVTIPSMLGVLTEIFLKAIGLK